MHFLYKALHNSLLCSTMIQQIPRCNQRGISIFIGMHFAVFSGKVFTFVRIIPRNCPPKFAGCCSIVLAQHMATFKLIRFGRPNDEGKCTIYLRITHGRRSRYRTLNRHCLESEWNSDTCRFTKTFPNWKDENDILRMYEARASDILRAFERDNVPFDFDTFEAEMFRTASAQVKSAPLLTDYVRSVSAQLKAEGRHGNSLVYDSLAIVLEAYKPKATLGEITAAWLTRLEHFMRSERRMKPNTMSVNMRTLRAVCNRAIKAGLLRQEWYPFRTYTIGHLNEPTPKRAISLNDVARIAAAEAQTPHEALARDLFFFSLYARGMNLVDIAHLKHEDLREGRIEYTRKKTGVHYSIALNENSAQILSRYAHSDETYCFPILSAFFDTEKRKQERIHRVMVKINRALRDIAARLGISTSRLSFYTARHTYATALKERGTSVEVISEAMGHADLRTTQIYLRSFDRSVLDEADKLLL